MSQMVTMYKCVANISCRHYTPSRFIVLFLSFFFSFLFLFLFGLSSFLSDDGCLIKYKKKQKKKKQGRILYILKKEHTIVQSLNQRSYFNKYHMIAFFFFLYFIKHPSLMYQHLVSSVFKALMMVC